MFSVVPQPLAVAVMPISFHDNGAPSRVHHHCRSERCRQEPPLPLLHQHLRLFDNITFIDGNSEYGQIIALHISKSHTHKVVDNPPLWFREQFEDFFSKL